jgi:Protein of unknown function (DUF3050)
LVTVSPVRIQLEDHPLYRGIESVEDLRIFMESHVFAVWDFMSLLKSLQASLTCVSVPWIPGLYPESGRLINEIVLSEESDIYQGRAISHFELYLEAMRQAGANTQPISDFLQHLRDGHSLSESLTLSDAPIEAQSFVHSTFAFISPTKPHIPAAAFTFGREDLIPAMFRQIVRDLRSGFEGLGVFEYYLERHIEVDGDSHGPMALQMMEDLCGKDPCKKSEAENAAADALEARAQLWDAILERIRRRN